MTRHLKHPAPQSSTKLQRPAPRIAVQLLNLSQETEKQPCFIEIIDPIDLEPGKKKTYTFNWNIGDTNAKEFHVDFYDNPNGKILGFIPVENTGIKITFLPSHPFPNMNETFQGVVTFDVPSSLRPGRLYGFLSLIE